jgi:large subunit ribosomal protein L10
MGLFTTHLPQWKQDEVAEIRRLANKYKLIGLVNMYGIPARQVQDIRRNLRGQAELRMTRNTLITNALREEVSSDILQYMSGHSALIFTNDNPFKLYSTLEKTKTKMVARPGEKAPEDIIISKGPTSFKPGPIVAELQQAGIPAAIESGKVTIRETKTVVKAGEEINKKLADALVKLDIKPMDIGLLLQAAFYEDSIYEPSVLAIDEEAFYNDLVVAATHAVNLSVNAVYPTKDTAELIITKAVRDARNLGVEAAVYSAELIDGIIGKAQREASALSVVVE